MVCSKTLSKFYSLHTHSPYAVDKSKLMIKLSNEKQFFFRITYRSKITGNIFMLCMFGFVSVEDDWCVSVLQLSVKPDRDTETAGVVNKQFSTMLTGTFEKKWRKNVA